MELLKKINSLIYMKGKKGGRPLKRLTKDELSKWIVENKVHLYYFAFSLVRDEAEAEHVVCEAIRQMFQSIHRIKDSENLKILIMSAVYNIANGLHTVPKGDILPANVSGYSYKEE